MDKKTAQNLIEVTFNSPFKEAQFTVFVKNLLNEFEDKHNHYSGNLIWDDYKEHINSYKRIGKYIDPEGEALDVLIVEVKSVTKLERARTALRNFVIKHLNKFEKDYALVAFYSKEDGGVNWRFSFIKLEYHSELDEKGKVKAKREFTPAKRYSFLVGEHEKSHTAKNQLLPLLQNIANNPTIKELETAFSIEKVTDEFFNQYKDLYVKFYEHFENDKQIKAELSNAGIDNARFTKKLLGQIVFLYFLQKKGWLGVARNKRWGTGKKRFVQELYEEAKNERLNFFKDKLQYLFYEALAKQRDNENSYYKRFDCRIPFLNGGLFEANYDWKDANITIPGSLFRNEEKNKSGDIGTGALDVFDRYNFTIKEDEPLDKEVAVDPEMLGKVFENMLDITERKSKGAFYTPREIVHYMCQESLIQYLDNVLNDRTSSYQALDSDQTLLFSGSSNKKGQLKLEIEHKGKILVSKEDIETFIREGHLALENDVRVAAKGETKTYQYQLSESIRQNANLIDQKLSDIKICDPAIGSGAFPVGLLHELVNAMLVLKPHLSYDYLTKKLKGFGFEHLESVNDSRYIYRLKRHIIQESIYGVDIDASAIDIARLRLWLSLVVDEDDLDPIETLPNLDYKIVCGNSLIGLPETAMRSLQVETELEKLKEEFYNITDEKQKRAMRKQINAKIRELLDSAEQFAGYKIDFEFKLFFSEVWRDKKGFDVVIGNPPYVQLQKDGGSLAKQFEKLGYDTFARTGDIYSLFYERGWKILRQKGVLCFITSNKWMRAGYGENTRKFFAKKTNPILLIDFAGQKIFETATVDVNILMFTKDKNRQKTNACIVKEKVLNNLSVFVRQKSTECDFSRNESWVILNSIEQNIKRKIEAVGTPLKDWDINIYRGILTGYNEAFIISDKTKQEILSNCKTTAEREKTDQLIRPILRGRDIKRYTYDFADLWLINTHNGIKEKGIEPINIEDYPAIKRHLDNFYPQLEKRADKGISPYNLRNCAYMDDFSKQKIIYPEITKYLNFYLDNDGFCTNNKCFIMSGENLDFLTAFFNSSLFKFCYRDNFPELLGGTRELRKVFLEQIPVVKISDSTNTEFEKIEQEMQNVLANQLPIREFELKIDNMIFDLYSFTDEERSVVGFIEIE